MNYRNTTLNGFPVLELHGRFDAHAAPTVADWLARSTRPEQAYLLVDFSKVVFIDSSGLACLVQGMKRCRQNGGDLVLCALPDTVRIIFELTRLERAFEIFPSQAAAAAARGGHP